MIVEAKTAWLIIVGAISAIASLMGWSHTSMRNRVDKLVNEVLARPTEHKVREMIDDKLESHTVQLHTLSQRIDELKIEQQKVGEKQDKLYDLCVELKHEIKKK